MGYSALSVDVKVTLQEIARLAYGTGKKEGVLGGEGRMGLLVDDDGKARVIKFHTHWSERWTGPSASADMIASSDRLRQMLVGIAQSAGLNDEQMRRVRDRLGLRGDGNTAGKLLDRKDVASVVGLIGGNEVWRESLKGYGDMAAYKSGENTKFTHLTSLSDREISAVANVKDVVRLEKLTVDKLKELFAEKCYLQLGDVEHLDDITAKFKAVVDTVSERGDLRQLTESVSKDNLAAGLSGLAQELSDRWNEFADGRRDGYVETRLLDLLRRRDYERSSELGLPEQACDMLAQYDLSAEAIESRVAFKMYELGYGEAECRFFVQAISAIVAAKLQNMAPADRQAGADKLLQGLADGTSGVLVAGMLLCKGGDAANPALWKRRLQDICKWNEAKDETDTREARLVMITDEQGAKLMTYFDMVVAKLGQLAARNGWRVEGDRRSQWEKFARFALDGNADELGNACLEKYLEDHKHDLALLDADDNAVRQLNRQINEELEQKFNGDELGLLKSRQLTISNQKSMADLLAGPTEKTIRAPQGKLRLALIRAIPVELAYASDPNSPGAEQTVRLTAAEFYAVLNGEFGTLTRLPSALVDQLRNIVATTAYDVIMSLEYKRDGVNVPENAKTVSDLVNDALSSLSGEKKTLCRGLLFQSFGNWLRDHPLTLGDTALSDVITELTWKGYNTLVGKVSLRAQAMSLDDLSIVQRSGLDVIKVFDKVTELCRRTHSKTNETASWHVLALLLQNTKERDADKLAQLVARFFTVLSDRRQSAGKDLAPDYAQGVFAVAASQCLDLSTLQSENFSGCVNFDEVTVRLANVTSVMNEIARSIVGENAQGDAINDVVKKLFGKLSMPKNSEALFRACEGDKSLQNLRDDLQTEFESTRTVQNEGEKLKQDIVGIGILRESEISSLNNLLGRDMIDEFYGATIVSAQQVDTFDKLKRRITVRKEAILTYRNRLSQSEGQDSVAAQAAKVMLRLLGRLPVKLLADKEALEALYARLKQDWLSILTAAQPHLNVLNAQATGDKDKTQALVALVQQVVQLANRYCSPKDALSQVIMPKGEKPEDRAGSDELRVYVDEISNALAQVVFGGNEAANATFARLKASVAGGSELDDLIRPVYQAPQGLNRGTALELYNSVYGFFERESRRDEG